MTKIETNVLGQSELCIFKYGIGKIEHGLWPCVCRQIFMHNMFHNLVVDNDSKKYFEYAL